MSEWNYHLAVFRRYRTCPGIQSSPDPSMALYSACFGITREGQSVPLITTAEQLAVVRFIDNKDVRRELLANLDWLVTDAF